MIAEARQFALDTLAIDAIRNGERPANDVYPTPEWAVDAILGQIQLPPYRFLRVLDPGAGSGVWGSLASDLLHGCQVSGCDIRDLPHPPGFQVFYAPMDYLTESAALGSGFDLIVGNPPYSLAEPFIRKSLELLAPGGQVVFLLRLAFLEGQAMAAGLWTEYPPERVLVMPKRPSFSGNGKTDAIAYAAFYWRQGWRGTTALGWL